MLLLRAKGASWERWQRQGWGGLELSAGASGQRQDIGQPASCASLRGLLPTWNSPGHGSKAPLCLPVHCANRVVTHPACSMLWMTRRCPRPSWKIVSDGGGFGALCGVRCGWEGWGARVEGGFVCVQASVRFSSLIHPRHVTPLSPTLPTSLFNQPSTCSTWLMSDEAGSQQWWPTGGRLVAATPGNLRCRTVEWRRACEPLPRCPQQ